METRDRPRETRDNSRVGAVVLAAGESSRMGEAKQLLRLGRSTLLEHVLETIRGAGVSETVLVLGSAAEAIVEQLAVVGVKVVNNNAYHEGMAGSLRAGLAALSPETNAALIILADQPFIRSATLDRIIAEYRQSNAQIVIPQYQGVRGNPVLLDRSLFPEGMALSGDIGCRAIFSAHLEGIANVSVDDPGILLDIDSKEDFNAAIQRVASISH